MGVLVAQSCMVLAFDGFDYPLEILYRLSACGVLVIGDASITGSRGSEVSLRCGVDENSAWNRGIL